MPNEDTVNIGAQPRNRAVADAPAHAMPPTRVIDPAPVPAPAPRPAAVVVPGYQVTRELARGGMGVVLAARDPKLGRDVAIKVPLPGRQSGDAVRQSGDAVRRFVQESRITARLPHPGVPPVYELGTLPDGSPFLAMKLVRGRTLAAELMDAERAADLSRLVQVFEQIAHAVGFAHSQNVIHRDLKPANVMVGAFGEVQVMDWGIAKEVGGAGADAADRPPAGHAADDPVQTQAGRALGTPAYMAPEQARGEPLGPPADVFALGGVLCDILTGHPPFEGDTAQDTIRRAARGDVAAAFGRLDACPADAELVALCKRLLSARAADRPPDGKAVADAVAAYRAGVERRLRGAETERAAADARAAEQRKKRRAQLALFATAAALVGAVGLGAWWQDRQAADRRLDEERRQQTERERLARGAAALDDLLARGEELVRQGDADRVAELLGRADESAADGAGAARLARLRAELALLEQLNRASDLDWGVVRGERVDREGLLAAWSAVFRPLGFVPGSPPSNETADRVRTALAREHLLAALEGWFWTSPSAEVLALLRAADPDRYRNAVRSARGDESAARLRELADAPDALRQPAGFALLFARNDATPPARRDQMLQALYRQRPNDFHVLMGLATVRPGERPEHTAERVGWYRAAIAVRPRNVAAWNNLGNALHTLRQLPAAVAAYREAVRLDPKFATTYSNLGGALLEMKDVPGAVAVLREAVRLDPGAAPAHNNLANALQDAGDLPGAVAAFREAVRLDPKFVGAHTNLACALCVSGDPRAAVTAGREAVRLDPTDPTARSHLGNALREAGDPAGAVAALKASLRLDPGRAPVHSNLGTALRALGDPAGAAAAYREAVRLDPKFAPAHSYLGSVLREVGDLPAAVAACREAIRLQPELAHAHHHLGLALKAAGDLPGATAAFREAVRLDPKFAPAHNSLGLALRAAGDLKGAVAAYRESIRVDPRYTPSYNNLGVVLRLCGDLPGALAALREAVRLDPKDALAGFNLGLALTAAGDVRGAVAAYRQVVTHTPDLFLAHANLAPLLRASGDRPGAIAAYREMVRLNPRHPGAHAALGLALLESGEAGAGRAALAEAARLDPVQFGPLYRQHALPVAPPPREARPPAPEPR